MKMKRATLILVVFIFVFNFILIAGYFRYFLIPQLSITIEANNEQLNLDLMNLMNEVEHSASLYTTIDDFANNKGIDIYVESLDGIIIYNNNEDLWNKGSISHVTRFFEYNNTMYILKMHKSTNTADIPALNNFIIFEIIVILVIVLIFFEITNQRVISPVEKLQKSIKNYKFGIKPSKTNGHTEFDIIQNNFVELVDALEDEKEKQNRIIASISHDIKTPLTSILGYSDRLMNAKLDETRKKQIAGDYFIRFGEYGDNKFDIENRLTNFLLDVYNNNEKNNTVLIVSHGSIISYMKRILNVKSEHLKKGKIDIFDDIDFNNLFKHNEVLKNISNGN